MKKQFKLYQGDNMESLRKLPDNSIDSVVTDPPYGLSFMGKKWDYQVPSKEFWQEVYRVLKPGGHVLSFGGTRTYHRMVVNLEDGGFEIRDCISWIYGSGFPKSLNIGKAVDKIQGNEREVVGSVNRHDFKDPQYIEQGSMMKTANSAMIDLPITKGTSPYEGQGTALKPAQEIICVARKPISEKTIAENVLKWGTGGLNIDGSRIGTEERNNGSSLRDIRRGSLDSQVSSKRDRLEREDSIVEGRFPANIILDEEAGQMLDDMSGVSVSKKGKLRKADEEYKSWSSRSTAGPHNEYDDKGGASRFFYCAKVSKAERNMGLDGFEEKIQGDGRKIIKADTPQQRQIHNPKKNFHPTIKPITLMSYLINLVTPVNGIILDPFMGSGSTGIAAQLNGFRFCGMEIDTEYFKIAEARIENYEMYRKFLEKKKKK